MLSKKVRFFEEHTQARLNCTWTSASIIQSFDIKLFAFRIWLYVNNLCNCEFDIFVEEISLLVYRQYSWFCLFCLLFFLVFFSLSLILLTAELFAEGKHSLLIHRLKVNFCRSNSAQAFKNSKVIPCITRLCFHSNLAFLNRLSKVAHDFLSVLRHIRIHHNHQILNYIAEVVDKAFCNCRIFCSGLPRFSCLKFLVTDIRNFKHCVESILQISPFKTFSCLCFKLTNLCPELFVNRGIRNLSFIVFIYKQECAVYKVTKVTNQLAVKLFHKVFPGKLIVLLFRAVIENVKAPCISRNSAFNCVRTEYTNPKTLRKLSVFIVQKFSRRHMMKLCPLVWRAQHCTRENNSMERNIIFTNELEKLNLFLALSLFALTRKPP